MLVDLGSRAADDYLSLVDFISEYSPPAAIAFIEACEGALRDLRQFPMMGMVESRGESTTRILRVGEHYHLTYRILSDRVFVLRIKDGRRQPES
jgi:plasmid stabilization system protein ParE